MTSLETGQAFARPRATPRSRTQATVNVASGTASLSIDSVSLAFGGVHALRDISISVQQGEIRAIIGPNGAGKSSLLNVVCGV